MQKHFAQSADEQARSRKSEGETRNIHPSVAPISDILRLAADDAAAAAVAAAFAAAAAAAADTVGVRLVLSVKAGQRKRYSEERNSVRD
jgi:hypothetical protein